MGLFSEVATEATIQFIVPEIKKELEAAQHEETREVLKRIGRFVLTQFKWSTPDWAKDYEELFAETKRLRILPGCQEDIKPHPRVRILGQDTSGFTIVEAQLKPGEGVCWRCGSIANDPKNNLDICPVCGKDFND